MNDFSYIHGSSNEVFYKTIFYDYYKILVLYSTSIVNDSHMAEDIVQELFIKCWTKNLLEDITSIESYLFLSVKNASFNVLRNNMRYERRIIYADKESISDKYSENLSFRDDDNEIQYSKIFESISKLPDSRRKIFELYYLKSLKYKDIANLMGISVNTVKVQLSRALKYLRENSYFFCNTFLILWCL